MEFTQEERDAVSLNEGTETHTTVLDESTYELDDNAGSNGDECGDGGDGSDEVSEHINEEGGVDYCLEDGIIINGLVDILNLDMKNIRRDDVGRYDFSDLQVAYLFYSWYSRMNGFCARKSKIVKSCKGEKLQQTFVCSREGHREDMGLTAEMRKREPRQETRCGCEAKFRVHIDTRSGRWYVTLFNDEHNHELLEEQYCALLPAHRKLTEADILQIESFRKVGISATQIYGSFANNSGGYDRVGLRRKDVHNQVGRQRRQQFSDASGALNFLRELGLKDPLMFARHTVDNEGRLQHLFWCDGESQMNYKVFGDVLAFDATYNKNKNLCPVVIFSGVNHHNQTIVFATALVFNETEQTYVWLLEQLMDVMKGKAPSSIITDGDLAMKNAIKKVISQAHHRLCAWHLIRNASSNVGNPDFMPYFKRCMLGDYDVSKFEEMWVEMVNEFGLEENNWIREMYEKRKMWATAHIRGNFFAGIRTTSRCEALHSHIKKFVNSKISLSEFVQQFQRCLTNFRFREVEADFESNYGDVVLQTNLPSLERSASRQFTKAIFLLFRPILTKASLMRVTECHEMAIFSIYYVSRYCGSGTIWHVSFCPSPVEFRCTCLRMESFGLPCDHIVAVLVYLDFDELPSCLVLDRWSKNAKGAIRGSYIDGSFYWDSHLIARHATLHYLFREIAELAHREDEDYNHIVDVLTCELNKLKLKYSNTGRVQGSQLESVNETVQDPPIVRTKGCGPSTSAASGRPRWNHRCRVCGRVGHNRRSCGASKQSGEVPDETNAEMVEEEPDSFVPSTSYVGDEND